MHKLIIRNLGPISECELECKPFMILTGGQASGKSTIAKALYYFRTVKNDVYEAVQEKFITSSAISLIPLGRPPSNDKPLIKILREALRRKFLRTFGYQVRELQQGMRLKYYYTHDRTITVRLITSTAENRLILHVELSKTLTDLINEYEKTIVPEAGTLSRKQLAVIYVGISRIFADNEETIYIPSGRSMLALLTNYMHPFSFQGDAGLDLCTQEYIQRISAIKPEFSGGLDGLTDYYSTGDDIPRSWEKARELADKVLCGSYRNDNGEERIILDDGRYVRINFASSGQQDALWITNILFWCLVRKYPAMLIIEEPESHLFPSSQKYITELISLVCNEGHSVLVTTHSPYVLGALNNLLYASQFRKSAHREKAAQIISPLLWLDIERFGAYFVKGGRVEDCTDHDMNMIDNGRIDEISGVINEEYDRLFALEDE